MKVVVGVALPLTIHPMQESLALSEGGASGIAAGVVLGFSWRLMTGVRRKWVRFHLSTIAPCQESYKAVTKMGLTKHHHIYHT